MGHYLSETESPYEAGLRYQQARRDAALANRGYHKVGTGHGYYLLEHTPCGQLIGDPDTHDLYCPKQAYARAAQALDVCLEAHPTEAIAMHVLVDHIVTVAQVADAIAKEAIMYAMNGQLVLNTAFLLRPVPEP